MPEKVCSLVLLADIAKTSSAVAATSRRLQKIARLTDTLRAMRPQEIEIGVNYLSGSLRQGRIGLGGAVLRELGAVEPAPTPSLQLLEVDEVFERIRTTTGAGSVAARRRQCAQLLRRATGEEQAFLRRLILGELRQGALEGVMVEAIAVAAGIPPAAVRRAHMLAGDLAAVARVASTEGDAGLGRFRLTPLEPVQPMLAQPADSLEQALSRFGDVSVEYKLDGARVQVHKLDDEVRVFTRKLNDVTMAVPEIVTATRALGPRSLILDGEVLALRPDGKPHPFQVTMRRLGRKQDVARVREELPLSVFFFDCLHREGADLIDSPAEERAASLQQALPQALWIPRLARAAGEPAATFMEQALAGGHEGVMVKDLSATYEAGRRGSSWLKVKPTHTLDLVVLAAEWGSGRRRGYLSNLHLGARDPGTEAFVMLGKTFKGLTDEMLAWQTRELLSLEVGRDRYTVFVRPELVVEIAFNEIQASRQYPGGVALRFARVKRYREDKGASEADTLQTVLGLHRRAGRRA